VALELVVISHTGRSSNSLYPHSSTAYFPASALFVGAGQKREVIFETATVGKDLLKTQINRRTYSKPHHWFSHASTLKGGAAFLLCCAAIHAIVGKASRAIATRNFSVCGRAFAFAVTAAVVCVARVHHGTGTVEASPVFRQPLVTRGFLEFFVKVAALHDEVAVRVLG